MARILTSLLLWGGLLGAAQFLAPATLRAQTAPPQTAVLDLGMAGGTAVQAAAITNQLRVELHRTGRVTLVDRTRLDAILHEQMLQDTLCTTTDCAVKLGRIMGIRQIITGDITRIDDALWQVTVQLIDVETAQVLEAEVYNHSGEYRSLLLFGIPRLAALLLALPPPSIQELQTTARLTLHVKPPDARISVDGAVQGTGPVLELALRPGAHELVIDRPDGGYASHATRIVLADNEASRLTVTLEPEAVVAQREAHAAAVGWWGVQWKWALGLGLAAGAWGYLEATEVASSNDRQDDILRDMKSSTSWTHYLNLQDDLDQAERAAATHKRNSDTALIIAGALLGWAAWVYFNPPMEPSAAAAVDVAPVLGSVTGVGLRVRW